MQPNDRSPYVSPAERAKAEMDKLLGYAPEVKEEKIIPPHGIYTDELGREHNMDDIQAQGSFYIKPETREVVKMCVIFSVPVVLANIVLNILIAFALVRGSKIPGYVVTIFELSVFAVTESIALYLGITKARGALHIYKADGRAFYVQKIGYDKLVGDVKIVGKEQILFKDVLGVAYTPTTLLLGDRGYKVEILTTYGMIRYDYIFPRFRHVITPEKLPFDVIKRNVPIKDGEKQKEKGKK